MTKLRLCPDCGEPVGGGANVHDGLCWVCWKQRKAVAYEQDQSKFDDEGTGTFTGTCHPSGEDR